MFKVTFTASLKTPEVAGEIIICLLDVYKHRLKQSFFCSLSYPGNNNNKQKIINTIYIMKALPRFYGKR